MGALLRQQRCCLESVVPLLMGGMATHVYSLSSPSYRYRLVGKITSPCAFPTYLVAPLLSSFALQHTLFFPEKLRSTISAHCLRKTNGSGLSSAILPKRHGWPLSMAGFYLDTTLRNWYLLLLRQTMERSKGSFCYRRRCTRVCRTGGTPSAMPLLYTDNGGQCCGGVSAHHL